MADPGSGPPLRGLYAITPDIADGDHLQTLVAAALAGGTRIVQYRNKTADAALALRQARALRELTRRHQARLIVNDDADLALAVDADGAHLGRDDGDLSALTTLRRRAPASLLIGVSCYDDLARARAAAAAGADYVAFGAFFASAVKPAAVRADFSLIARAKAELAVPVVAIGGITRQNAPQLIALGVDAVAVISALFGAADVAAEARHFCRLFADEHK